MKINPNNVDIIISAVESKQYPETGLPEIALSGRSNVGKSTFINTLISRKKVARTSSKPGKTQTLNFFNIDEQLIFVDVPGYGYAKVSKKQREQFGKMIEQYLTTRKELKCVIQLIDIRHKPTQDEVLATFFLEISVLINVDLPTFDLPLNAISGKPVSGYCLDSTALIIMSTLFGFIFIVISYIIRFFYYSLNH